MYVCPSIGPEEWSGPQGPLHTKIQNNLAYSDSNAFVSVKMFEISNQKRRDLPFTDAELRAT